MFSLIACVHGTNIQLIPKLIIYNIQSTLQQASSNTDTNAAWV